MKTLQASLICVFVLALYSCSTYVAMKPEGENTRVTFRDQNFVTGELLAIQDETIYVLVSSKAKDPSYVSNVVITQSRVVAIPVLTVGQFEIEGLVTREWGWNVFLFQAIPTILFTIAGASYGDGSAGAAAFVAFSIPTLLTYLLFEGSTPPTPMVRGPMYEKYAKQLKMYARYPMGVSMETIEAIAQQCTNKEIMYLD
jgi:hypothetical protein